MDELFRFVALRPPVPATESIVLDGSSPLARKLADARGTPKGREAMNKLAESFVQSADFVNDPSSLKLRLGELASALEAADASGEESTGDLVEHSLGSTAAKVAASPEFRKDVARLQDSLLAMKLAPSGEAAAPLLRLLRAANAVRKAAAGVDDQGDASSRLVLLPASIFPLPPVVEARPVPVPGPGPSAEQTQLLAQARSIRDAILALSAFERPAEDMVKASAKVRAVQPSLSARQAKPRPPVNVSSSNHASTVRLDAASVSSLAPSVRKTLDDLKLAPAATTLPVMLHTLKTQLGGIEKVTGHAIATYGPFNPVTVPQSYDDAGDPKPAAMAGPPVTHGQVKPAGMGDLLVVRQHVLGYAPGDVAYVENVAQGETLVRSTRRAETLEDIVVTSTATSRTQERDVQTTDRFDIRRESQEVLRSESARQPGSPGSAAYGVVVETGGSNEQTQQAAETFGRDVSTRAVSRVTDSLRVETTNRRVQEFAETVSHTFDNTTGQGHGVVVYQWLDRVVEAQVFTYGKRVFYDLVLPEPAALLLRAMARRRSPDGPPVKPAPFTIESSQLNEVNYTYYTAGYGATGVEPPPEAQLVVGLPFAKVSDDIYSPEPKTRTIHEAQSAKITIPPGYRAVHAIVAAAGDNFGSNPLCFILTIGKHLINFLTSGNKNPHTLDGEVGTLPVTLVSSDGQYFYSINVEIVCEPTERHMEEWRQRTHDAIVQAARARMQEYEERAANLRASIRMDELNFTLERKRSTEREELERACLTVLTNQHFDGLSAIEHSSQGYPQSFLPNVEPLGRYVRFFQQAFEWEQMTWRYYPYFWGRKQYWLDRIVLDDSDPQFRDFLRAGSARVLLSVRPGFRCAVAHFMETGTVPTVEELGQMASKMYLPFLSEETGSDQAIEKAKPYGKPWEIRAPTALVKVRSGKTLPNWTSVADAEGLIAWVPGMGDAL